MELGIDKETGIRKLFKVPKNAQGRVKVAATGGHTEPSKVVHSVGDVETAQGDDPIGRPDEAAVDGGLFGIQDRVADYF